ncbi:MAG: hypothetical protein CBE33_05385 [Candidatus Pelagibacter sp. TMED273]|nr:MAG: hypothetical protein CBE33_05385 [Candidatus Pelagibacter sp. TMED273]|tara:strand:- start:11230 stop:12192 length:963 start_codon:yes stop_codon:yes gene_type:complete
MSLNILVTGSSGYLGSSICEFLSKTNHNVTGVDIKSPEIEYKNLNYVVSSLESFINTDKSLLKSFDLIIHSASVLPYKGERNELVDTNIKTTKLLVDNIVNNESLFFVYISSSGVYGNPKDLPIDKGTELNPLDLYAKTKISSENYIQENINEKRFSIVRPRTILGENRGGIFSIFFSLIKRNIPIPIPNKGNQKIQFVDVHDLTKLIIFLGENKINGIWPGAAPNPMPLKEHLNYLGSVLNKKIITFNVNPKLFLLIGNILIFLKITNFTKWHFGAFPNSFYFDYKWKPSGFDYEYDCNDSFMKCASSTFLNIKKDNDE